MHPTNCSGSPAPGRRVSRKEQRHLATTRTVPRTSHHKDSPHEPATRTVPMNLPCPGRADHSSVATGGGPACRAGTSPPLHMPPRAELQRARLHPLGESWRPGLEPSCAFFFLLWARAPGFPLQSPAHWAWEDLSVPVSGPWAAEAGHMHGAHPLWVLPSSSAFTADSPVDITQQPHDDSPESPVNALPADRHQRPGG